MINILLQFWKDVIEWVLWAVGAVYSGVTRKRVYGVRNHPIGYFKKGDIVISRDGNIGRVWRIYRKIETEKVVGCSVTWETPYKGDKISAFLPAEDLGDKFNPVIKRYENG